MFVKTKKILKRWLLYLIWQSSTILSVFIVAIFMKPHFLWHVFNFSNFIPQMNIILLMNCCFFRGSQVDVTKRSFLLGLTMGKLYFLPKENLCKSTPTLAFRFFLKCVVCFNLFKCYKFHRRSPSFPVIYKYINIFIYYTWHLEKWQTTILGITAWIDGVQSRNNSFLLSKGTSLSWPFWSNLHFVLIVKILSGKPTIVKRILFEEYDLRLVVQYLLSFNFRGFLGKQGFQCQGSLMNSIFPVKFWRKWCFLSIRLSRTFSNLSKINTYLSQFVRLWSIVDVMNLYRLIVLERTLITLRYSFHFKPMSNTQLFFSANVRHGWMLITSLQIHRSYNYPALQTT